MRRKHCELAVVRRSQKFRPTADPFPWGAARPKFNQLEMVTTFMCRPSLVRIDARNYVIVVTDPHTHKHTGPITVMNNWSHNVRRFYGQFNNIMSVLGKGYYEMTAIYLLKTYCLPTLMYASENSGLVESDLRKINVIWNNCFRYIFSCCWRE